MHFRNDKFMISCPARSGSSMLCSLIHSHPQAICHHEVFAIEGRPTVMGIYARKRRDVHGFEQRLRTYRDERPEAFLYDIVFNPQGRRCVGFKFKTDEALQPAYRAILDLIVNDSDIKIIHLVRRNVLDQYISHRVVEQTGKTFVREGSHRPEPKPIRIDTDHLVAYVRDVRERQQSAFNVYRQHRAFVIYYEDIIAPGSGALADLQAFLELDHRQLSTTMTKIIRNSNDLVSNPGEVQAVLKREDGISIHGELSVSASSATRPG